MHVEKAIKARSGWPMLFLNIALSLGAIAVVILGGATDDAGFGILGVLMLLTSVLIWVGFFVVPPNQAAALILFGDYRGTVKDNGFWWANPFMKKTKVSLRARTLNGDKLKVNDRSGNPIEIAAVVVWKVIDTAEALFDVEDYSEYVSTQSEAAVRKLASAYSYDGEEDATTLRGATEEVNHHLQKELQERLRLAGVEVMEARIRDLAYAPEIAGAMLRRQQAQAVVDARRQIVDGAVGMVEHALEALRDKDVLDLDPERRAAMVSNLMVVLCGEHPATPVVNAGTLYS